MVPESMPTRVAGALLLAAGALGFAPPVTEGNSEASPPGLVASIEALVAAADADGTGDLSLPEFSAVVLAARRAHEDAALAADDECACHSENAFRILDGDDSGAVSAGEIEALLAGAVAVSAAELEELPPRSRRRRRHPPARAISSRTSDTRVLLHRCTGCSAEAERQDAVGVADHHAVLGVDGQIPERRARLLLVADARVRVPEDLLLRSARPP